MEELTLNGFDLSKYNLVELSDYERENIDGGIIALAIGLILGGFCVGMAIGYFVNN